MGIYFFPKPDIRHTESRLSHVDGLRLIEAQLTGRGGLGPSCPQWRTFRTGCLSTCQPLASDSPYTALSARQGCVGFGLYSSG
eukprot:scaffold870_cov393-Prasinococcus_capsulatus_cf.AAC.3